jgi:hypothetical protein
MQLEARSHDVNLQYLIALFLKAKPTTLPNVLNLSFAERGAVNEPLKTEVVPLGWTGIGVC